MLKRILFPRTTQFLLAASVALGTSSLLQAQLVPGSGVKVQEAGDDFEDEEWEFIYNYPKSSREQDGNERRPLGYSSNGYWIESAKRGVPDYIKRVQTPPGGLPGSKGALMMRSLWTGVPNRTFGKHPQDDLLISMTSQNGGMIPVSWNPSVVVRVYFPPFDQWENKTAVHFGFRADLSGKSWQDPNKSRRFFRRSKQKIENYWPGFFVQFNSETDARHEKDSAIFVIRCDERGQDFIGQAVTPGWWTLGMSFTSDGRVHYYAKPGVDRLTRKDYIASHFPYNSRAQQFATVFFNICNQNDGRTWSTPIVVDDIELYHMNGYRQAGRSNRTLR